MTRAACICGLVLLALAGCAQDPAVRPLPPPPPPGSADGAFFEREFHLDRDRPDEFRKVRDAALGLLHDAMDLAGQKGVEAPGPFDDSLNASELAMFQVWISGRDAEGTTIELRRARAASLSIVLTDTSDAGGVDGVVDRIELDLRDAGGETRLSLRNGGDGPSEDLQVGNARPVHVSRPELKDLLARAQRDLYAPFTGDAYRRLVKASATPARPRRAAPPNTSFPGESAP